MTHVPSRIILFKDEEKSQTEISAALRATSSKFDILFESQIFIETSMNKTSDYISAAQLTTKDGT